MPSKKIRFVAGVDEAGRGPLAGPVFAAAVILNPKKPIEGLEDSKLIPEKKRIVLAEIIRETALAFSVAQASVEEIDSMNIFHASLLAMKRAVETLSLQPHGILVDGTHCPPLLSCQCYPVIKGDQTIAEICAASILAKVARDQLMIEMDSRYPGYNFKQHKGYATEKHLFLLKEKGPCEIHRRSFFPIKTRHYERGETV